MKFWLFLTMTIGLASVIFASKVFALLFAAIGVSGLLEAYIRDKTENEAREWKHIQQTLIRDFVEKLAAQADKK